MDSPLSQKPINGGKRAGAGRKKKADLCGNEDPYLKLAKEKARHEETKADLARLEYGRQVGELCEVAEVQRVFATAMALLVQELRSIPDMLERRVGLTGAQAEQAEGVINGVLMATKAKLGEALHSTG